MRVQEWVKQFVLLDDGTLPAYIDFFEPIEVQVEEFWYALVAEATDHARTLDTKNRMATAIVGFIQELEFPALLQPEPSVGFQDLLDQIIAGEDYLPQVMITWHVKLAGVVFKYGANRTYWIKRLKSCPCNSKQTHKDENGSMCVSHTCGFAIHHHCAPALGHALLDLGVPCECANLMMFNAKQFLNWGTVQALAENIKDGLNILKFLKTLDMQSADVGGIFLKMSKYLKNRRWHWSVYFKNKAIFKGVQME